MKDHESLSVAFLALAVLAGAVTVERAVEKDWPEALTFLAGTVALGLPGWYVGRK